MINNTRRSDQQQHFVLSMSDTFKKQRRPNKSKSKNCCQFSLFFGVGEWRRSAILYVSTLLLCLLCINQNCVAQIIYDSPPVGVSLTRPVLPWLARYFVGAGDRELHFLDEPQRGLNRPPPPGGGGGGGGGGGPGGGGGGPPAAGGAGGGGGGPSMAAAQGPAGRGGGAAAADAPAGPPPSAPAAAPPNGAPPPSPLSDLQTAQLRQLQYMAQQVPVPVLSAPVMPPKAFAPPFPPRPLPLPLRARFDLTRVAFAPGTAYPTLTPIPGAYARAPPADLAPPAAPAVAPAMSASSPLMPPPPDAPPLPSHSHFLPPPFPMPMPFIAPVSAPIAVPPPPPPMPAVFNLPYAYEPMPIGPPPPSVALYGPPPPFPPAPPPPLAPNWAIPMQNNMLTNGSLEPKSPKLFFRDVILGGAMPPPPVGRGGAGGAPTMALAQKMSKFNG
ncbi:hypothetical protein niasHT_035916 [Heterodera trifolii]|uniref:Uncharacterized protein n=1 Tax=Heterodera trifolii TaxID=157864 RepID=A0ABD2ID94_9BILA